MNPMKAQSRQSYQTGHQESSLCYLSVFVGKISILVFLLFSFSAAYAQDSLKIAGDSLQQLQTDTLIQSSQNQAKIVLDSLRNIHSPRKAAFYSAVLPGLGQVYNHQYIKVPLMLGGIGVATGIFIFNFDHYITYRDAYRLRLNDHYTGNPRVDVYSQNDLRYLRDGYRQYVDYSVLGFAAVYLYNILDAIVFAYLYHFDVSNDLGKLKFGPVLHKNGSYAGIGFTYTF